MSEVEDKAAAEDAEAKAEWEDNATREEKEAVEDGEALAEKYIEEQDAREDDDPLVLQKRPAFTEGEEGEAEAPAADEGEYAGKSKEDLEAELEARGLAKSGNKADLIARLQEDDEANA
jgi:SAP domain